MAELIDAARRLLVSEGVPALSVRRLAQEAGCTTMSVYTHFGGKSGILEALFNEGFTRLAQSQCDALETADPRQRVIDLCAAYLSTARAFPHHYDLMLGRHSGEFTPSAQSAEAALATLQTLVRAVATFRNEPVDKPPSEEARAVATSIFAFCHGWVSLGRVGLVADAPAEESPQFERAVLGLLAPQSQSRS